MLPRFSIAFSRRTSTPCFAIKRAPRATLIVSTAGSSSGLSPTASAIAKASLLLGADLDSVGSLVDVPASALKLLRDALDDEEQPLQLPPLVHTETQAPISPRIWSQFISALLTEVQE